MITFSIEIYSQSWVCFLWNWENFAHLLWMKLKGTTTLLFFSTLDLYFAYLKKIMNLIFTFSFYRLAINNRRKKWLICFLWNIKLWMNEICEINHSCCNHSHLKQYSSSTINLNQFNNGVLFWFKIYPEKVV